MCDADPSGDVRQIPVIQGRQVADDEASCHADERMGGGSAATSDSVFWPTLLLTEVQLTEYPQDVTQRFHGSPEQMDTALVGEWPRKSDSIVIEDYDQAWVDRFAAASSSLHDVLDEMIIEVEHVGSTSVPGLAAKPIIDIDLVVADTADESRYVPTLERLGYRLVLREPWWHGHRMLVSLAGDIHLHVWPQGAPEPIRHRLFRDWLRSHPEDRELYAATKRRLARDTHPNDYSLAKNAVIDQIFARIFAADGEARSG
jgi:GrpB-like predicted nucleotidyltransferase (UPF0157 family)